MGGDLDERKLGIISGGDIIEEFLPAEYPNVNFEIVEFDGQLEAIEGVLRGEIDGFITSGGVALFMNSYLSILSWHILQQLNL